jgi:tRNA (guanosine-2'-O-)-methyltransferase
MNDAGAPKRLIRAEAVLAARRRGIAIVLEDTHDPHNVSAVLRTCEALGVQDVHIVSESGEPMHVNKDVAIGAHRWLTLHRHDGAETALRALRDLGYRVFVSQLTPDAVPLPELPRDARAAYVFGNEHAGISPAWTEHADARFVIPTSGFTGSLNLSVAAALTVYDRLLARSSARFEAGDLSDSERATLRETWYKLLAHGNAQLEASFASYLSDPPNAERTFPAERSAPASRNAD